MNACTAPSSRRPCGLRQQRCDTFLEEYNTQRPHQALGQVPPATQYAPSARPYPARLEAPQYPALTEVRRVRSNGQIKWHGELVFLSEALVGELVGITEGYDSWLVSFGPIPLGRLHPRQSTLERLPPRAACSTDHNFVTDVHS